MLELFTIYMVPFELLTVILEILLVGVLLLVLFSTEEFELLKNYSELMSVLLLELLNYEELVNDTLLL